MGRRKDCAGDGHTARTHREMAVAGVDAVTMVLTTAEQAGRISGTEPICTPEILMIILLYWLAILIHSLLPLEE